MHWRTAWCDGLGQEDSCAERIYLDYANIVKVAIVGTRIFLDDGLIELVTKAVESDHLVCRVQSCLCLPSAGEPCD